MSATANALERPWHIRTTGGGFYSGFDDETEARSCMADLNKRAERLNLQTRYVLTSR